MKDKDFLNSLISAAGAAVVFGIISYLVSTRFGIKDDVKSIVVSVCVLFSAFAVIYLRRGVNYISDELGENFMNERTGILKTFRNLEACEKEIREDFSKAKDIRLLLQIGRREFGNQEPSFFWTLAKEKKEPDSKIRVLKASINSPFLSEIRARKRNYTVAQWRVDLRRLNEALDLLKEEYSVALNVREHSEPFLWRIFLFDDIAYVSAYLLTVRSKKDEINKLR